MTLPYASAKAGQAREKEIRDTLRSVGATAVGFMVDDDSDQIIAQFRLHGREVTIPVRVGAYAEAWLRENPHYRGAASAKGGSTVNKQLNLIEPTDGRLAYNGTLIRDKGEMLSLTDMWKAAGSVETQKPYEWLRHDATKAFVECVGASLEEGQNLVQTKKGGRGIGGSTFAHWQVALAYAKYLSPEFHMWCNSVVRAHMAGRAVSSVGNLPPEVLEIIERNFGVSRMLSRKVTEMERTIHDLQHRMVDVLDKTFEARVAAKMAESALLLRKGKTAKQIWDAAGMPRKIKGATKWFGNRLVEAGCLLEGRADRGDGSIRLFDPDKAETQLRLGLKHLAHQYAAERKGQGRLRLVTPK